MKATSTSMMLEWSPRTMNQEADALTNMDFRGFSPDQRIKADIRQLDFMVLPQLMAAGEQFERERDAAREAAAMSQPACQKRKRTPLRVSDPW